MWAARGLGARFPRLSAALMVVLVLTLCCGGGCSGTANRGQQQKTTADAESLRTTPLVTSVTGKMVIKPQFDWTRSFSVGLAAAVRVDASADLGAARPGGLAEWSVTPGPPRGVSCPSHAANASRPSSSGPVGHLRAALTAKPVTEPRFRSVQCGTEPQVRSRYCLHHWANSAFPVAGFQNGNPDSRVDRQLS